MMKETKKLCQEIRTLVKKRQFDKYHAESFKTSPEVSDWYESLAQELIDDAYQTMIEVSELSRTEKKNLRKEEV